MPELDILHAMFAVAGFLAGVITTILRVKDQYVTKEDCEKSIANCKKLQAISQSVKESDMAEVRVELKAIKDLCGRLVDVLDLTTEQRIAIRKD